ncbi:MAG: tetratricopeptide repeat protein [Lentimicrobium sp.]
MKIKCATFILLIFSFNGLKASEYSMNANCLKAYDLILKLRFDEANTLLKKEKSANPSNRIIPYLENYQDFLQIIISEEEDVFNTCSPQKKTRLSQLERGNKKSPWHLYCQAQVNMQWAFARIKFGEFTTAALELNRSYRQLEKNRELFPAFSPNNSALALLRILIGSIPENYKWIAGALSYHGNVNEGIAELRRIINNPETPASYPFIRSEGIFLLSFITINFSASPDDTYYMSDLLEHPDNKSLIAESPLLIYAASVYSLHTGKNSLALKFLLNRPKGPAYYPFHYLEYLTGIAELNKLNTGARIHFLRFVVNFKGKNFIKSAYQRIAWIELLNDNKAGYNEYMERVRLMGSTDLDGDRQAMADADLTVHPDISLLKARLLFDGGYYEEALLQLRNLHPETLTLPREQIEYTYRFARICHKSGNTKEAIKNYIETLSQGRDYPYYFAANAALQLGIIYGSSGNKEKARYYYHECLNLDFDEYHNSISQKAKAGLSGLK